MPKEISKQEMLQAVGRVWGPSGWLVMDQPRIDAFADVTQDHQFIHVDSARAAQTALGGTVAHGMLTLSMLSAMAYDVLPVVAGAQMSVNYGFDRLRFISPVPSNGRIRGRFLLAEAEARGRGDLMVRFEATVEIEGAVRPALKAAWLLLYRF